MAKLSHPNIAAVYDWGEEVVGQRATVYAVTEYLGGGSLRDLFDRGRYLDPSQALMVGLEACRGLDLRPSQGLVHSEVTPAKLVFGDDRRLRIVDFGLARMLGEREWADPSRVATHVARYASPEQAAGRAARRRSPTCIRWPGARRGGDAAGAVRRRARPWPPCRPVSAG